MKVKYTSANGRLTFEFESENDKTLFANLAHVQEIFEEQECGCCKNKFIRFDVREFDGNHYYKLVCDKCGATLDFGQHKTGNSLFPKRRDGDSKELLPNNGWYRYADREQGEQPKARPSPSANRTTPKPSSNANSVTPQRPAPAGRESKTAQSSRKPPPPLPVDRPATCAEAHAHILWNYSIARGQAHADEWAKWGRENFDFSPTQDEEQSDAYHAAMERLGLLESVGASKDIPF